MRDIVSIAAEPRGRAGKGNARATRRTGRIPAVIYGNKQAPEPISVDVAVLTRELHKGGFFNRLVDIDVAGKKQRVLPREVQLDPVSDRAIHADFMRVAKDARVRLFVPVTFTGTEASPGIKRGGVLNVVRHEIEFYCPADAIPDQISVDVKGLEIGDSVHISHIALPAGVRPVIADRDFTVATIAAPTLLAEVEEKPAAVAAEGAAPAEGAAGAAEGAAAGAADKGKAPAGGDKGKAPAGGDKGKK